MHCISSPPEAFRPASPGNNRQFHARSRDLLSRLDDGKIEHQQEWRAATRQTISVTDVNWADGNNKAYYGRKVDPSKILAGDATTPDAAKLKAALPG